MNTVTHLLAASAILTRTGSPARNRAVVAGALLPDAWMFVFFGWASAQGLDSATMWGEAYYAAPWATVGALFNSVPLALGLVAIGLTGRPAWLLPLGLAMGIHAVLDFPVHADDAHRHFWPLTEWRFVSPLSYWDTRHHAAWVAPVEVGIALGAAYVLTARFPGVRWLKPALAVACLIVIAGGIATVALPFTG